jgi:hypothetical protein
MINSLNQLHFTSSNIDSKQMAESSQSQHLEGWTVNISISVLKSMQLITM